MLVWLLIPFFSSIEFAHVLELLETDFYKQALAKFQPQDFVDAGIAVPEIAIQNFQAILEHEAAHTQLYVPQLPFPPHFINVICHTA
jgi:hypothetical protein